MADEMTRGDLLNRQANMENHFRDLRKQINSLTAEVNNLKTANAALERRLEAIEKSKK